MNGGICWIRGWMKRERNEERGRIEILIGGGTVVEMNGVKLETCW